MSGPKPLVDLEPSWVYLAKGGKGTFGAFGPATKIAPEEQGPIVGVSFSCPSCSCGHRIAIPFKACPTEATWLADEDTRWDHTGDEFETLKVTPSINCDHGGSCKFHGHIGLRKPGQVTW